ncbi:MAG TPA: muconolactone Delta-isomerase family protein [Thermodesulfobacteriota bacterium]|nr:muconolactone Delta-isomerase family protein [Thermodesulfobacteriota bacterium]
MTRLILIISVVVCSLSFLSAQVSYSQEAKPMKYLVKGTGGPASASPADMDALLKNVVLPTFDQLTKLEKEGKITGGVPVGDRALVFIIEASSNEEVDNLLRSLPLWGVLEWKVVPLQTFEGRAAIESKIVEGSKKAE